VLKVQKYRTKMTVIQKERGEASNMGMGEAGQEVRIEMKETPYDRKRNSLVRLSERLNVAVAGEVPLNISTTPGS
jgi:hypothetical protein